MEMGIKKTNSREALLKARSILREQGISTKRKFVTIICTNCKKEIRIQTSNKEMYTEQVRANYVCLLCKGKVAKQKVNREVEQKTGG
jgi:hypothetical protein